MELSEALPAVLLDGMPVNDVHLVGTNNQHTCNSSYNTNRPTTLDT